MQKINIDGGMLQGAYENNIFILTKRLIDKHHIQVSQSFQLRMDIHRWIKIDKCRLDVIDMLE